MSANDRVEAEIIRQKTEIWKQLIQTQMHFNDLCVRIKWLGITIGSTIIGTSFVLLQDKKSHIAVLNDAFVVPTSSILLFLSFFFWLALREMDRNYYTKMLIASVDRAEDFERGEQTESSGSLFYLTGFISKRVTRDHARKVNHRFYSWFLIVIILSFLISVAIPNESLISRIAKFLFGG
jgi:uncharacterized membrane protein